jgi:hypothetical protein
MIASDVAVFARSPQIRTRSRSGVAEPKLQVLPLNLIHLDAGTQSRESICYQLIDEYADGWLKSADFPPIDVFRDHSGSYYLADGFHRLLAAKKVSKPSIPCRVFHGSAREAFLFACTVNQTHGLRRTNADKRYMVTRFLSDREWVKWTDSRIAEQCGVSHTFVAAMRRELESVSNSVAASVKFLPRRGSDGKNYPPDRKPLRDLPQAENGDKKPTPEPVKDCRTRTISLLRQTKRYIKVLGLDPRHMIALEAIEKDVLAL